MKTAFLFGAPALVALVGLAGQANASILYGATSAGHGELYILNPATGGALTDVGPLNDGAATNYSVTGLAFDPTSGLLYGSTGGVSGTKLLTINPATATVTVVGSYGAASATMTDLAFDPSGNLYGVSSSGGANLYSINKATAAATEVGASGISFTEGGGLAISSGDVFYAAPIPGDYGTYNSTTGTYTQITAPATPAGGGSYAALAFDGNTLYGDNLITSPNGVTHLVTIDPTTGTVTDIGPSITHLDALAVSVPAPEPSAITLLICSGAIFVRRQKKDSIER